MSLFGEKSTIDLTLTSEAVVAGDSIVAHVVAGGEDDDKLQGGRVELAYENQFYKRVSRSSSPSSSSLSSSSGGSEDVLRRDTVVVATEAFGPLAGATPSTYDVALTVPPDAPASADGWVDWNVTAVLDRRRARDRRKKVPLTVLAPPGLHLPPEGQQASDRDCDMFLELSARTVRLGATLAGVLHVVPTSRLDARGVRLELEHRMHHEDHIVRTLGKEKTTLAGATALEPGEALRLPFQVDVPRDGIPSLRARHNEVRWSLKGVCDRRLRGDYTVEAQVAVYNAG